MATNCTGRVIRKYRIKKGLTVEQLSSALGPKCPMSPEALRQIELRQRKVYDFQLLQIAQILGKPVQAFFHSSRKK